MSIIEYTDFQRAISPLKQCNPNNPSLMSHIQNSIIEPYHAEVSDAKFRNLQFGFVDDITFNAFASLPSIIAVNLGALAILAAMFRHMLSRPDVLAHVGDPKKERENLPNVSWLGYTANIFPQDPVRRLYATYLHHMAIDFLTRHELAHIRNGHISLLQADSGLTKYMEISNSIPRGLSQLDIQTLEMDADCYAAGETFRWNFLQRTKLKCTLTGTEVTIEPGSPETMYWFCFVTYAFFSALYEAQVHPDQLSIRTHPPANMRQIQVIATVREHLNSDLRGALKEAAESAARDCAIAFAKVHGTSVNAAPALLATSKEYREHSASLLDNWKLIRPRLEKHVRAGILAL